jgi:hypothetical protein
MTINCDLEEVESILPSVGLIKTTNGYLAEVVGLLLSGGLRKTMLVVEPDYLPNS